MTRGTRWLSIMAMLALLTAACGGDDDDGAGGDAPTGAPGETDGTDGTAGDAAPEEVETDTGVTDDAIRVAVLNDFSGPLASIGTPSAIGVEIYFDARNADGGICGRQVEVVREDTMYDNQVTIQKYRAVKDDVVAITQLVGTAATLAVANDIARDGIMVMASTGSGAVIPLENIYLFITPFPIEAINAVSWAAEEQAGDDDELQLGVIYQGDPYGEEGLSAVEEAAEELGNVDIVATASYAQTDQDFSAQVQAMQEADAEVVYLHATPRQTAGVLGVASQRGYEPIVVGNSPTFGSALVEPLGALLDNFRVVTSAAFWGEDVPGMADFLAAAEEYAPDLAPDTFAVVGWNNAVVQAAALERACELGDLTQAGVLAAMDGLEVDLEGMGPDVSYGATPDERIPSREVRISGINLETSFAEPVTEYFSSEAAEAFTLPEG